MSTSTLRSSSAVFACPVARGAAPGDRRPGRAAWRLAGVLASAVVLPVVGCDAADGPGAIERTEQPAFGNGSGDLGRYYRLRSVSSDLCLDVEGKSTGNGVRVLQFTCSSGENQQWYFRQLSGNNEYQLSAKHSAKCLRVDGGSGANNAILEQDPCARSGGGFTGTRFTVTRVGSATPERFRLATQASGQCVQSPSAGSGVPVVQNPCNDANNSFLWIMEERPSLAQSDANGRWSGVTTLPLVPAAVALLPNKKVLAWSSWKPFRFGGSGALDQTMTAVVDPANPGAAQGKLITNTIHNMFCPGIAMLADGRVFVNGGDDSSTKTTSIYNPNTDSWSVGKAMIESRWYNSSVTLPDGRVFTLGGNRISQQSGTGEIWNPANNTWTKINNLVMGPITSGQPDDGRPQEHPRLLVAPNGRIFIPGPTTNMQFYDVAGSGAVISAGKRGDDEFSQNDITVMFDKGKILKAGGNPNYDRPNARFSPSSQASYVIDINGATPTVTKVAPMKFPRAFGNGVVLANGQVVAVGGLDNAKGFSDDGAVRAAELFDPATNTWRELAPMARTRPYHSVALLLADGRVLVGGGGLCSSSDNCAVNHPDVEILSPPYLFGAARPTITSAPGTITANGGTFSVGTSGTVSGFSLVRMAAATHSVNTDQRFLRLVSSGGGGSFTVTAPANKNLAPPGFYLLFALNGQTPSVAAVVRVQ
jgi:galactose oxidase